MRNQNVTLIIILSVLACFALLRETQAVAPTPDGCYPGYTTAEGCNALNFLTTGAGNSGFGWYALYSVSTGSFNTGVGGGALALNNGDSNTAVGAAALLLNTAGTQNVAVGTDSMVYNDSGTGNTAVGVQALFFNTTGDANTASGFFALLNNTTGSNNTAIGVDAAVNNDSGIGNTGIGFEVLDANTTGNDNTAIGTVALSHNTGGSNNIAVGVSAGDQVTTASNVICIGAVGANVNNGCYIGQIFGGTVPGGATVIIDNKGHLGTIVSSQRFKDQIKPMDNASEAIFALKPVTFRYEQRIDSTGIPQFGLVAEDVEKVNPDLVVRDKEGKPYTVRYEQINAMLLNEFLKEHQTVQEQQREIEALKMELREQRDLIQKVSDRVEMTKPAELFTRNP